MTTQDALPLDGGTARTATRTRRGRFGPQPAPAGTTFEHVVAARFTTAQREALAAAAKAKGVTVGEYLRQRVLEGLPHSIAG